MNAPAPAKKWTEVPGTVVHYSKTLLLVCCAPCAAGAVEAFAQRGKDFAVYFYNPNIDTREEHDKRLAETQRLCRHYGAPFIASAYQPQAWQTAVKGLEDEPERGRRCYQCFLLRLKNAAQYAKANGYDNFTSVLGVSRHKDMAQVNAAAAQAQALPYDLTNWRKAGLDQRRRAITKELTLYEQSYCGCKYSKR
jgi:predicted adenine nucleotide alpha hydrolase (AANH) superfamily ATPase